MSNCIHQGWPSMTTKPINTPLLTHPKSRTNVFLLVSSRRGAVPSRTCGVRASTVDSHDGPSASSFAKRMEQAWLISQQPRPVSCTRCNSDRIVEGQDAAPTVKGLDFGPSGWRNQRFTRNSISNLVRLIRQLLFGGSGEMPGICDIQGMEFA
ncbi:hypothetical protein AKJ16_DCAP02308 [Drosera capensis]